MAQIILAVATLVTAAAAAFVSVWNALKLKEVKAEVNGRLNQLLETARHEAYHRGKADAAKEAAQLSAVRRRANDPPAV